MTQEQAEAHVLHILGEVRDKMVAGEIVWRAPVGEELPVDACPEPNDTAQFFNMSTFHRVEGDGTTLKCIKAWAYTVDRDLWVSLSRVSEDMDVKLDHLFFPWYTSDWASLTVEDAVTQIDLIRQGKAPTW